jgi:hypothetical protein
MAGKDVSCCLSHAFQLILIVLMVHASLPYDNVGLMKVCCTYGLCAALFNILCGLTQSLSYTQHVTQNVPVLMNLKFQNTCQIPTCVGLTVLLYFN